MSWFKSGDEHNADRRWLAFRRGAERMTYQGLWHQVGTWAASPSNTANGVVPLSVPKDFGARPAMIQRMFAAGWWHADGSLCDSCSSNPLTVEPGRDAFVICRWWVYMFDAATVERKRESDRIRQSLKRERDHARDLAELEARMSRRDTPRDTSRDSERDTTVPTRPDPTRPLSLVTNGGVAPRSMDELPPAPPLCKRHKDSDGEQPCGICRNLRLRWEADRNAAEQAQAEAAKVTRAAAARDNEAARSMRSAAEQAAWQSDPAVIAACPHCADTNGRIAVELPTGKTRMAKCQHPEVATG